MAEGFFFALTLTGDKASDVWDPDAKSTDDDDGGHQLIVKRAVMGAGAKDGEQNVVQVEAMTYKDSIKVPVAVLEAGTPNCQVPLDLTFPDPPVTFTLIKGKGPVHLIGNHFISSNNEEYGQVDEMEEEMVDDEEAEEAENTIERKRKLSSESEEEEEENHKSKKAKNGKDKAPAVKNSKVKK